MRNQIYIKMHRYFEFFIRSCLYRNFLQNVQLETDGSRLSWINPAKRIIQRRIPYYSFINLSISSELNLGLAFVIYLPRQNALDNCVFYRNGQIIFVRKLDVNRLSLASGI